MHAYIYTFTCTFVNFKPNAVTCDKCNVVAPNAHKYVYTRTCTCDWNAAAPTFNK